MTILDSLVCALGAANIGTIAYGVYFLGIFIAFGNRSDNASTYTT